MTTINAVGTSLSGQTGTGAFAGSVSPTLTTPIIARINDASGNAQLNFTSEPSAVNYVNIYNTSTGNGLAINALGADTNIGIALGAKGTGVVALDTQALTNQYQFTSGTSFVHTSVFNFPVTALTRTYTWPDADGTVALASSPLSGYVLLSPSGNQTITDHDLYLSLGSFHSGSPAGGVNGNFTAYPTTANSGFIEIIANTNSSGNFGVVILPIGSIAQTQTLSIPDAGQASSTFILSTSGSGQTIGGGLTVNGGLTLGTPLAPTSGGTGTATAPSAGQIPIGNNGGTYTPAAINSGTNITVANGSASITVNLSGVISPTLGGTGVNNGSNTLTLAGTLATSGAFASVFTMTGATNVTFPTSGTLATTAGTVSSVSGTLNRITSTGGTTPVIDISASYVGQSSITTLGTITTGVWQGTLVSPIYGGTGVNNGSNTLTLAGTLATSGAFASVFTMTGATNVTFPTSGTLATTATASGIVNSGLQNQLTWYAASGTTVSGLATANNGLLVTSSGGVPSIGNAIGADITVSGATVGLGGSAVTTNLAVGVSALAANTSGVHNHAFGYQAMQAMQTGNNNTAVGYLALNANTNGTGNVAIGRLALQAGVSGSNNVAVGSGTMNSASFNSSQNNALGTGVLASLTTGNTNTSMGNNSCPLITTGNNNTVYGASAGGILVGGSDNTLLGTGATTDSASCSGAIAIGEGATATIATGVTSADAGPGIAIGSSSFPVGFRGNGTIYPSSSGAGFWRAKINGTQYFIPLFADSSTSSGAVLLNPAAAQTIATYPLNLPGSVYSPAILDSNGANMLTFVTSASAVNYFNMYNSPAGSGLIFQALGASTDINVGIYSKGAGTISLNALGSTNQIQFTTGGGGVHTSLFNFPATSASRTYTYPDATGTMLISGTAINSVPSITFSSTSGIIGTTTNDSAAAGSVGEEVQSIVTRASGGVSLTNATSADITSISLTAGDWDVWGNIGVSGNGATTVVYVYGWISSTSASTPDAAYQTQWSQAIGTAIFSAGNIGFPVPGRRFSLSGTTTIYLSVNSQFAVSTEFAFGGIYARRRR